MSMYKLKLFILDRNCFVVALFFWMNAGLWYIKGSTVCCGNRNNAAASRLPADPVIKGLFSYPGRFEKKNDLAF